MDFGRWGTQTGSLVSSGVQKLLILITENGISGFQWIGVESGGVKLELPGANQLCTWWQNSNADRHNQ
jgi:hypothetical protein